MTTPRQTPRRRVAVAIALALVTLLAACHQETDELPALATQARGLHRLVDDAVFHAWYEGNAFQVPFYLEVKAGARVKLRVNRARVSQPVLAVHAFRELGGTPSEPPRLVLRSGDRVIPATVTKAREGEPFWNIVWPLGDRGDTFGLEIQEDLAVAVQVARQPVTWGLTPQTFVQANPFRDRALASRHRLNLAFVDYFYRGGLQRTYLTPWVMRCTRANDYAVVYLDPQRPPGTTISCRITEYTKKKSLAYTPGDIVAAADGRPLPPSFRTSESDGRARTVLDWRPPADVDVVTIRPRPDLRFELSVRDGLEPWLDAAVDPNAGKAPAKSAGDDPVCFP